MSKFLILLQIAHNILYTGDLLYLYTNEMRKESGHAEIFLFVFVLDKAQYFVMGTYYISKDGFAGKIFVATTLDINLIRS